ncbi:MAG: hypothetical protein V1746_01620 [bacterium]
MAADIIDVSLLDEKPTPEDIQRSIRDILYMMDQAFAFTLFIEKRKLLGEPLPPEHSDISSLIQWNASVESSLNSLRALNEFLTPTPPSKNKKTRSDIRADMLQGIGYTGPIKAFLKKKEYREISQMLSHLTANRNTQRNPKKNWPLAQYLESMINALEPIILFFQDVIYKNNDWNKAHIQESQKRRREWLKKFLNN